MAVNNVASVTCRFEREKVSEEVVICPTCYVLVRKCIFAISLTHWLPLSRSPLLCTSRRHVVGSLGICFVQKITNPKQVLSKITIQALIDLNQMLYLNHIRWLIFSQKCVLFCSWHYLLYSFRKGTISSQFPKLLPCDIKIFTLLSSHYLENVRRIANALQVTLWTLIVMIWLFLFF